MSSDVSTLSPYAQLVALERRLQAGVGEGGLQAVRSWTGLGLRLRDQLFVAPRADVREVLLTPRMTRVPNAPDWMRGVANVRGALYPVMDLGRLLGEELHVPTADTRLLLLNAETDPVAFLVDEVFGYRNFEPGDQRMRALEEASPTVAPYLLGGFVRDGQPWLALSLHRAAEAGLDEQPLSGAAA
ncbi:MAG: chemotaxis protein CheW [Abyssibacter sp.]|jgi:twitching motility protein PilI|uniref:chemotaxis protein CheW n=1 Tax=Abyssibacter sp. TaxID=2320200 RepID=UPI00321BD691